MYASYLLYAIKDGEKKVPTAVEFRASLARLGITIYAKGVTGCSLKKDTEVALFEALAKMAVARGTPINTEPKAFVRDVKSLWSNLLGHFEGRSPCECVVCHADA